MPRRCWAGAVQRGRIDGSTAEQLGEPPNGSDALDVLCLDLEGVLVPEIWIGVAERTGIPELRKTTRDVPVYDDLMRMRLEVLRARGVGFTTIRDVIAELGPLPGANAFLAWARQRFQIAIVSDSFYEFATPLMAQLGHPMLLCHRLEIRDDRIVGYTLRQTDPKRQSVRAFQGLGYRVHAVGDSFNDVPMLEQADRAFFFRAPDAIAERYPAFARAESYRDLERLLTDAAPR